MSVPSAFCWTRVGTEAGQPLHGILRRKELERVSNGGLFFWGIGNAIGPSMGKLVQQHTEPEVLFSPIKSSGRIGDADPPDLALWRTAEGLDGRRFELPPQTLITSRMDPTNPRKTHYALVCYAERPLIAQQTEESVNIGDLENLITGRAVGASQVTAVVKVKTRIQSHGNCYRVLLRATLRWPYFLVLRNPTVIRRAIVGSNWDSIICDLWNAILSGKVQVREA